MSNTHNKNMTFACYIMCLYAVCYDAGAGDMPVYMDNIVYILLKLVVNECRNQVGLLRLFKTILVHTLCFV